jgi:hypothetical protein
MAQIRIPCLVGKINKAGITSWYWQPSATLAKAGWKAIAWARSTAAMAAAEKRNEDVEAWKPAALARARSRSARRPAPSATCSRATKEFLDAKNDRGDFVIARSTARTYRTALKRLNAWAGDFPLAYITPARVKALRKAMTAPKARAASATTPRTAP